MLPTLSRGLRGGGKSVLILLILIGIDASFGGAIRALYLAHHMPQYWRDRDRQILNDIPGAMEYA